MTQTDRILHHMQEVGPITAAAAMQEYGCFRLAARIADLKKRGYPIHKEMVTAKNRFGESTSFAQYSLEGVE